jgi:hypothetical protein
MLALHVNVSCELHEILEFSLQFLPPVPQVRGSILLITNDSTAHWINSDTWGALWRLAISLARGAICESEAAVSVLVSNTHDKGHVARYFLVL